MGVQFDKGRDKHGQPRTKLGQAKAIHQSLSFHVDQSLASIAAKRGPEIWKQSLSPDIKEGRMRKAEGFALTKITHLNFV